MRRKQQQKQQQNKMSEFIAELFGWFNRQICCMRNYNKFQSAFQSIDKTSGMTLHTALNNTKYIAIEMKWQLIH